MKRLDVCNILKGDVSPENFSEIYQEELRRHLELLKKGGASAPVFLSGNEYIFINDDNFRRVLSYAAEGRLHRALLGYVFDALSLDEMTRFADAPLREALLDLADNGTEMDAIIAYLSDERRGRLGE